MSKVILTQEQADIIETTSLDNLGEWFYKDDRKDTRMYKLFCDFSIEKLAKAKLIGYEVKPTFKVADYIVYENEIVKNVMQIINIDSDDIIVEPIYEGFEDYNRVSVNSPLIRHATPEEIAEVKESRWWNGHDRGVWELRKGDILYDSWLGIRTVFHIRENGKVSFSEGHKEYEIDEIKESYRVACFAENRLDVKDDE